MFGDKFYKSIILIVSGMLFLSIRNADPLINPIMYAEDGTWIASALSHGWVNTFIHARDDYFVFFNMFFLFISSTISNIITGNPLILLPQSIALMSYFFYAFVSMMMYSVVRRISTEKFAFLIYFLGILLPLGGSQNENIGRLLQIGFYMPVMAICFILYRESVEGKLAKCVIDLMVFLSSATNPIVFAIVGLYYFLGFIKSKNKLLFICDLLPLIISMIVLFIMILPRLDTSGGLGGISYNPNNLIEMVTARQVLYPFIFPWYGVFNNEMSIYFTVMYILFCSFVFFKTKSKVARKTILVLMSTLVIVIVSTSIGRSGLTGVLNNYRTSFPDRYFAGANALSVFLFVVCLSQCDFSIFWRFFSKVIYISIVCLYVLNFDLIIQSNISKNNIRLNDNFVSEICNAKNIDVHNSVIKIQPSGWEMRVPTTIISQVKCRFK